MMFADRDISLRSPGGERGSGDCLRESVPKRTDNDTVVPVPRPADGAGTADHHGATGGIAGD